MNIIQWHVAAMNHWREIVAEQVKWLAKLQGAGHSFVLRVGFAAREQTDEGFFYHLLKANGLDYQVVSRSGLGQCEIPTMLELDNFVKGNHDVQAVVYMHTKGASSPGNWVSLMWRWLLQYDLFNYLLSNGFQSDSDIVCSTSSDFGGYCPQHPVGTFWLAKAAHLKKLPSFERFHESFETILLPKLPWSWASARHSVEPWVGYENPTLHTIRQGVLHLSSHAFWASNPDLQREISAQA